MYPRGISCLWGIRPVLVCTVTGASLLTYSFALPPMAVWAQTALIEDLQGALMVVSVTHDRTIRRDGREIPNKFRTDWKIRFNSVDSISVSAERISSGPRKTNRIQEKESVKTLARPKETASRGGGHALWIFEDDTLTFLRTYQGGGMKATFTVARSATGFDCTAKVSWLREEGTPIVMKSFVDEARLEIVSSKQVASSCRIMARGEAASR
jgi:hypothetical protein